MQKRATFASFILPAAVLFIFFSANLTAQKHRSAVEEFQSLTSGMRQAHKSGDWKAFHASALKMVQFLNGSPDTLLDLARADVHISDPTDAFKQLRIYAEMGQANEIVKTLPDFAALRASADFEKILERMAGSVQPTSHATKAFTIPDAGLVPEDIDYDGQSKRFFLTSVVERKIVTLGADGHLADFAKAPDNWPMLALKVDARRRIVWATEVAMDGFISVPKADWGRSALLGYSLDDGKLLRRLEGPRHSNLGDMALDANGDLLISDGTGGGVYLERTGSTELKRVDKGDFISPQTPAFVPGGQAFVADYVRGIGLLNLRTGDVRWIPMQDKYALEGIDGMYFDHGWLIAVQNGTTQERVMAFKIDANFARVTMEQPIESATPELDPTHGVIVGAEFYFIANSGWNELDDNGSVRKGALLAPARIMRAQLPN
ncbi:MAG TPA: hypothetical protein VGR81_01790 [Candidatus Acidoferrales bacterium]|nr:hypothetical protein [Candidatus Acidoferrales bacterium]